MPINEKYNDFTKDDFFALADRFGVGEAAQVIHVEKAIKSWPSLAKKAGVNQQQIERIKRLHLRF